MQLNEGQYFVRTVCHYLAKEHIAFADIYIYIYIYMRVYVCVCVCIRKDDSSYIYIYRYRFLGRKNPQHAFLRRGSKAVGPMS